MKHSSRWCSVALFVGLLFVSGYRIRAQSLTTVAQLGHGSILNYAWSDDGHTLALSMRGALYVYHTGQPAPLVIPVPYAIDDLALNLDGSVLLDSHLADDGARHIVLLDTTTGAVINQQHVNKDAYVSDFVFFADRPVVAFLHDAIVFLERPADAGVWLWDYSSDAAPQVIDVRGHGLAVNADQMVTVTTSTDFQNGSGLPIAYLYVREAATGAELHTLIDLRPSYTAFRFSPTDPHLLASLDDDGIVRLWDVAAGEELRALTAPLNIIDHIAFNPAGTQVATAGEDDTVRVWDVATGALLAVYADQPQPIIKLQSAPDGRILAFGDPRESAQVWDARTGATITHFAVQPFTPPLRDIAFNATGERLIAVAEDGTVYAWNLTTGEETTLLADERLQSGETRFSPDGSLIVNLVARTGELAIWHFNTGDEPEIAHFDPVRAALDVVFAPDGRALRALLLDGYVGEDYCDHYGEDYGVRGIEWSISPVGQPEASAILYENEDPRYWAVLSPVAPLFVFDNLEELRLQSFDPDQEPVWFDLHASYQNQVFAPGGGWLATGTPAKIRLINLQTYAIVREIELQLRPGMSPTMVFDPTEKLIAATTWNRVEVYVLATGERVLADESHVANITGMAFSTNGSLFAAASRDGTVNVWRFE